MSLEMSVECGVGPFSSKSRAEKKLAASGADIRSAKNLRRECKETRGSESAVKLERRHEKDPAKTDALGSKCFLWTAVEFNLEGNCPIATVQEIGSGFYD